MYKVIFSGKVAKGQDIQTVKKKLAALHKVPLSKIEPLFSGGPVTLKEDNDLNAVMNIKSVYERVGAICTIEEDKEPHISMEAVQIPRQKTQPRRAPIAQNRNQVLAQVMGKPGRVSWGTVVPAFWGTTKLEVYPSRVVERTTRLVSSRHSEILTSEIDSVVINRKGNPLWLVLGFLTLSVFGLGILFLILYFFVKHKFLVVFSKHNSQVVAIVGDERPYQEFKDELLSAAEAAKRAQ